MNIPSLPTDNLYKFMAIVGVIITVLSFLIPARYMLSLQNEIIELETEIGVLLVKSEYYKENVQNIDQLIESKLALYHVKRKSEIIQTKNRVLLAITGISIILLGFDGYLIYKGFANWYLKLQIHLDRRYSDNSMDHNKT